MADSNDVGKGFKLLQIFWPIGLVIGGIGVAGVRADARISEVERKSDYTYINGSPAVVAKLARIEERQLVLIEAVNRINDKIDRMGVSR